MTKIGLLGGTFDPLHNGHYELAVAAVKSGLDRVIVIPAGRPPHKTGEVVSMAAYRYEMAARAFSGHPSIAVSDMEILRPGPSYTLDTIRSVRNQLSFYDELFLVYGSDILDAIERWHKPAEIMSSCPLLLARRGGSKLPENEAAAERLRRQYGAEIFFFDAPEIELSSSRIRKAIRTGDGYRSCLPHKVVKFIQKHALYRYEEDLDKLDMAIWQRFYEIERILWPLLKRKRLLHSLDVLIYSLHLALVHGVSPEKTGIAALLHDCAKCLPKKDMLAYAQKTGEESLFAGALAHAPAGCTMAVELFGVSDPEILRAIRYHSTGCAGMSKLEQIIFIADKVEPSRTYANLDQIRELAETDLDAAMVICFQEIDLFLRRENLVSHPLTHKAYHDCIRRTERHKKRETES